MAIFICYINNTKCNACLSGTVGSVAVRAAGYGDRRVWVKIQANPVIVSGYSGVCFEIKFSGRHRGFDGVLFNLWPLANAWFRDAQY